ncbi:MAG: sigma 54-interacting transcriptional regulator [Candidatus Poribacteria bacterium]|nr:sigma 54-interacting transcriptional regulator [Candidatus Poribacteria bacterium]
MIHRTRNGKPRNKANVFILGDVSNDTVRNLEHLLEKDGYDPAIVAKDRAAQLANVESEAVLLVSENGNGHPIPQRIEDTREIKKAGTVQFKTSRKLSRSELQGNYAGIIGRSPRVIEILRQIDKVANTAAKVLICGETGTGKELIAQALHQNSDRSTNEMISLNCAAIPGPLLESELFGHERGSFTGARTQHIGKFERAHNNTLFLDEIGDMPLSLQVKLLRAVETGKIERLGGTKPIPVDIRIVAATHCNLAHAVENGTFRKDLYYRLNAVSISIPPLRERQEDIQVLAEHFIEKHGRSYARAVRKILPETLTCLQNYPWPGNVRELENVLIHALLFAEGNGILPTDLPEEILAFQKPRVSVPEEIHVPENQYAVTVPLGASLKAVEEAFIRDTLAWQGGNRTKTAEILGISIRTLQNRLKDYEISENGTSPA